MTGKIERAIKRAVRGMQQRGMKVVVNTADVVFEVYGNAEPTRGQLAAVLHEMQCFVRKHQDYVLTGGQGPSRLSIIIADDVPLAAATRATPGGPSAIPPHAPGAPPRSPGSSTLATPSTAQSDRSHRSVSRRCHPAMRHARSKTFGPSAEYVGPSGVDLYTEALSPSAYW